MEVTMKVPEGLFKAFNDSDVTIDMDYDPVAGGAFSSAAVTLDENVMESSFTGQGGSVPISPEIGHSDSISTAAAQTATQKPSKSNNK